MTNMGDYQPLHSVGDCEVNNHVASSHPVVRVKQPGYNRARHMSPLRTFAFVMSILFCLIVIAIFLWAVPCDWATCPAETQQMKSTSWDIPLNGLELKGRVSVVQSARTRGLNLVAMLRGAVWGHSIRDWFAPNSGGLISLVGSTGELAWWIRLTNPPVRLDCTLLDGDLNGIQDCLVLCLNGYLVLVNSISGMLMWHTQSSDKSLVLEDISFPEIIPDVDGDGVKDLAVLCRFAYQQHHVVALISGKRGFIIGQPFESNSCADIHNLTLDDNDYTLYYNCKSENDSYSVQSVSLHELVWKTTATKLKNIKHELIRQAERRISSNEWKVGKHRLNLVNSGECPSQCMVILNITDDKNQTIWGYQAERTYAMRPVIIHFNSSISGFLLKFWQWNSQDHNNKNGNITSSHIKERVVLVTFNSTESAHIVNASQTDIIQLCLGTMCQPELDFQSESLLIVDLDQDGCQELISYLVTYKADEENALANLSSGSHWKLQTKVRVIRLEAELPKLYEAISRQ